MSGWAYVDVQARVRFERRNAMWKVLGDCGMESEVIEELVAENADWIDDVTWTPEDVEMSYRRDEAVYVWAKEMGKRLGINTYPPVQPPC